MHQNYIRPSANTMNNSYGRVQNPTMLPQQRPIVPQYNMNQPNSPATANMMTTNNHQSQYYNHPVPNANMNQASYQNIQRYVI